jgi:hypothetical protein
MGNISNIKEKRKSGHWYKRSETGTDFIKSWTTSVETPYLLNLSSIILIRQP